MSLSLRAALLAAVLGLSSLGIHAAPPQVVVPASQNASVMPVSQVEGVQYPALDLQTVAAEDALRAIDGGPARFAIAHDTAIDIQRAGTWETVGTQSIWRYRVNAADATSLNFGFTHYRLPPSARLFVYDVAGQQLAGPWDERKNQPHGELWTPVISAADVIIEVNVETAERERVELVLGRISQGYRAFGRRSTGYAQPDVGQPKFGNGPCTIDEINSGTCNTDVACLGEDDPWNDPRRAVGAITVGGTDTCSGSLIGNTADDRRRLFATATHCGLTTSSSPSAVVYWNYEWPTCRTPGTSASGQVGSPNPAMASSGATFVAATPNPFSSSSCTSGIGATCSDWTLIEFDDPFDPAWNLYWEGWDRRSSGAMCSEPGDPTSTVGMCASIHHPGVDEKRITFVPTPLSVSGISRGTNTHWHAAWDTTPPILPNIVNPPPSLPPSVTEGGSSGSPLYSPQQRIVGVLSGGSSYCGATGSSLSDEYGQLAVAWEGRGTPATRMRDHLDPLNTGAEFIDGMGMTPFTLALDPLQLAVCTGNSSTAIVTVSVDADAGFSAPVTLSASDVPPGATATFAPGIVTPPGTSNLTLGALASVPPGSYNVKIDGTSGVESTFRLLSLKLSDTLPATTGLLAPADGASDLPTSLVLSWSAASTGPTDYQIEVATDPAFASVVLSRTVSNETTLSVTLPLSPQTTFYWRVRATNGCGNANWSQVRSFTTGVTFPEPFCAVTFPSGVEPITRVKFSGIDNRSPASPAGSPAHEDFLGVAGGMIEPGQAYQMLVEGNTAGNYTTRITAFFDWNRNGSFDSGETFSIGSIANSTGVDGKNATATITVPAGLASGPLRMRVIKKYSSEAAACNSSGYGQAEDYLIDVPSDLIFADGFEDTPG